MSEDTEHKDTERERRISERAFQIWVEEGQPYGKDREHWQRAEAELFGERSSSLQSGKPGRNELARDGLIDGGEGQAPTVEGGFDPDDRR